MRVANQPLILYNVFAALVCSIIWTIPASAAQRPSIIAIAASKHQLVRLLPACNVILTTTTDLLSSARHAAKPFPIAITANRIILLLVSILFLASNAMIITISAVVTPVSPAAKQY